MSNDVLRDAFCSVIGGINVTYVGLPFDTIKVRCMASRMIAKASFDLGTAHPQARADGHGRARLPLHCRIHGLSLRALRPMCTRALCLAIHAYQILYYSSDGHCMCVGVDCIPIGVLG